MANQKNHYYVLVFTSTGPVYVTSVDNSSHSSCWHREEAPKSFTKSYAEDIVLGLNLNGYNAVLVSSKWELYQPYNYNGYECTFTKKS